MGVFPSTFFELVRLADLKATRRPLETRFLPDGALYRGMAAPMGAFGISEPGPESHPHVGRIPSELSANGRR